ncbi:MAG: ferrous iron transport protein B [Chloroflexi bacterium]|nr:ferrous iron transport protein B [Chloroflexota bacterium]
MTACHEVVNPDLMVSIKDGSYLVALAGQPNMGKSTIFNNLTGLNQHVGNWPGKTIDRCSGQFHFAGKEITLIDLPGTYSLTANSPEEIIAREFILRERPDVVVAVVSAANLERSLYLVSELITLKAPLIVALNMMDVAEQEGLRVDTDALERTLGVPVVPMTATRSTGTSVLQKVLDQTLLRELKPNPVVPDIRSDHRQIVDELLSEISGFIPIPYPSEWIAFKLLEGDHEITRLMQAQLPTERWETVQTILKAHEDAFLAIVSARYEWIEQLIRVSVIHPRLGQIGITDRLDRWAAHPFWGLAILASILGLVFELTFSIGVPVQSWLAHQLIAPLTSSLSSILGGAPVWLDSQVINGVMGGVGAVVSFLPIMVIFFAAFGLLEDMGYMARAAYVMDNLMHMMGLHGKSFLPLFLGFGCNVPAVMGARTIDSRPARLLTILVAPLIPCTARMAVVAFLAPAFFGSQAILVTWGLVILSVGMLVASGALLNQVLFKGQRSAFIMEMPLYHIPNGRTIGLLVWQRSLSFLKKAGTTILAISIGVWALSVLPGGSLQTSYLAQLGHFLEPVGRWMGLDWRLTVALLTSFMAKENAVATLGVLFGAGGSSLAQQLAATYSMASALSFLTVSILFIPCAATVAVVRQETGSWRWTLLNISFMLALSVGAASMVYAVASRIGM